MRRITIALCTGLLVACGGGNDAPSRSLEAGDSSADLADSASGFDSEMGDDAESDGFESADGGVLRIRSISLDPAEARPGENVQVRVSVDRGQSPSYDVTYTWEIAGHRIADRHSAITLPGRLRKGSEFSVHVSATDGQGGMDTASARGEILNTPPTIYELHLEPEPDGSAWVAKAWGRDPDGDEVSFQYTWLVNGLSIDNDSATLSTESLKRGDQVRVRVAATDGESEGAETETGTVEIANSAPEITSSPPRLDASGRYAYQIEAEDRDGDVSLTYELVEGPEGMEMNRLNGQLSWKPEASQAGDNRVEIAVNDGRGGRSTQVFNVPIVVRTTYGDSPAAPGP